MLHRLPLDSSLRSELPLPGPGDEPPGPETPRSRWTQTDYLLADIFDLAAINNWLTAANPKNPTPMQMPRPEGAATPVRRGRLTPRQVAMLRARAGR